MARLVPGSRPVGAFILSLVGGVLILVGGAFLLIVSRWWAGIALISIPFGIVVILASLLLQARPQEHSAWGVIILVFSCASIIGTGGFIVGMILGIVGGSLGIAWRPGYPWGVPSPMPVAMPASPWRPCARCGSPLPWTYIACPHCGTPTTAATSPATAAPATPPAAWPYAAPTYYAPPVAYVVPQVVAPQTAPQASEPPMRAPCPTCTGEAEWDPYRKTWICKTEGRTF